MSDAFVKCRTLGHQWDEFNPREWTPRFRSLSGLRIAIRCSCCGTERREVWAEHDLHVVARSYSYPTGYSFVKPENVPGSARSLFRSEYAARVKAGRRARLRSVAA